MVTFYSFFTMVPRGRHTIRVCLGTACYVRGGKKNLDRLVHELGIDAGHHHPGSPVFPRDHPLSGGLRPRAGDCGGRGYPQAGEGA